MIDGLVSWSVRNRLGVLLAAIGLCAWGVWALEHSPIDAIPDISDVQVIISTEWSGHSPDLIENQITYPIVTSLIAKPRVRIVQGSTDFGVSRVYVIFDDGTDIYWARARVTEYLQSIRTRLPADVSPSLGSDATGVGWVYEYALVDESGRHSLTDLRSLQDWSLRYWLGSVPGVAEVASIGGFTKQFQVTLDPDRLAAYGISPIEIADAIRRNNGEAEGRVIELAGREHIVRGRGYLKSIDDIAQIAVADKNGVPIRIGDVSAVKSGTDFRRAIADLDGRGEVVGGIVIMRSGENALRVIDGVKQRLQEIRRSLPEGVRIVPTYDRSQLIRESVHTLSRALIEEAVVVTLIVIVFLLHARPALVMILTMPVAILMTFIPIYYAGMTWNIMALGGLALAIGVLVDGSIIMVENASRRLSERLADAGLPPPSMAEQRAIVTRAALQLGRPIALSLAIIVLSFVPVFLLEGQEGRMFLPLAMTKTIVMAAAALLSVTLVPVLMIALLPGSGPRSEADNPVSRGFAAIYAPVIRAALRRPSLALGVNFALILAVIPLLFGLGSEFMPTLYEGSLLYMPVAAPGITVSEMSKALQQQDRIIRDVPEVERVFGTAGAATTATDNSPLGMVNTIIQLKPRSEWRSGMTLDALKSDLDNRLRIPGFANTWTQPIRGRLDMLATGLRTPLGLKVLGPDLTTAEGIAQQVQSALQRLDGTRGVYAEQTAQGRFIDIVPNREALGRYGVSVADLHAVIATAIGGENVSWVIDGRERYPISVRYAADFRDDLAALSRLWVKTPSGARLPVSELAQLSVTTGPAMIRDDNGFLAAYVYVDPRTSDIGGYVARAKAHLDRSVRLPAGYAIEWSGQYPSQLRARARLKLLLPIVFTLILACLYWIFRSASEAVLVMLSVAYAMTGGLFLQWLLGYPFSVAVWVGYIALYGIAVQTGVVMLIYLHEALNERLTSAAPIDAAAIHEAVIAGSVLRLRPKLMTVGTVLASLLPIMWSTGFGADLLKPIAAPIIGGMVTSAIHVLVVTPVIFYVMKTRAWRRGTLAVAAGRA